MARPDHHHARLALAGAAALVLSTALMNAPAQATPAPDVVADGLDNPRQLTFRNGALFIAEAGTGGEGPCFPGPEGDDVCFGTSGAITRVRGGTQVRLVTGLPSLADADGAAAIGPADVRATGNRRYAVSIGLGADPAARDDLPAVGKRLMGTIATGRFGGGLPSVAADLAAFEAGADSDDLGPDSNPTGLLVTKRGYVATDSGANTLMRARRNGTFRTIHVFESPATVPNPFGGDDIPVQPVPTSVVRGPDGAFYVSELTGFPFVPGLARIHRIQPGGGSSVYGSDLTNVTDLAWHDGDLYAVQIADEGLLVEGLPRGSLVRVIPGGGSEHVAGPFPAPYGVAIHDGSAYVTTCAVCPDEGSVVKVPLN